MRRAAAPQGQEHRSEPCSGPHLLQRLKAETAAAHARIEARMDLPARLATQGTYRDFLARLHGFLAVWEPQAEAAIGDPGFFAPRRKIPLLRADLEGLGLDSWTIARLPRCHLSPPAGRAEAWGSFYVMEGSTLGGALIAREALHRLGPDAARGCRYLRCYGGDKARMWKGFGSRLLAFSDPAHDGRIVAAANRTFGELEAWLCGAAAFAIQMGCSASARE